MIGRKRQSRKRFPGVVWNSQQRLAESHVQESTETGTLIAVLAEMLGFLAQDVPPAAKIEQLEATIIAHGGLSALQEACKERTEHEPNHWQPFADEAFWPYRRQLLALARTLPLKAARPSERSLIKSVRCVADEPSTCDSYTILDLDREFLPPRWRALTDDEGRIDYTSPSKSIETTSFGIGKNSRTASC
jgi:hypothetical protein